MYWVFSKSHEQIALLKETSGECITSTLSDGDKELVFNYPKNGRYWQQIECEGYVRTEADEYVIKDIESGETSDKYTCKLNLEELEGKTFPDGFESVFATFEECMTQALSGTGWHVVRCDVKKRRTIRRDAGASAMDVISQCISTYKIEIEYDTIGKMISVYERRGADRGRYFMESLNLRSLAIGKNTYDFYTELVPIGKDGLTIESVNNGRKYITNYTYCSKKKRTTWIDRRYTDPNSLLEDAVYKLEEMARPYTTYEADVTDLAHQNDVYKNILDYGLGDMMVIVSKSAQVREKQRIVKMVEYPRNPERNTCELSSARKSFVEIQQQDTDELTDAISGVSDVAAEESNEFATHLFETLSDDVDALRLQTEALARRVDNMNTDEQIGEINDTLQSISESLSNLATVAAGHESRLAAIEETYSATLETVSQQQEAITEISSGIQKIRQSIQTISGSVETIGTTLENQAEEITAIKTTQTEQTAAITSIGTTLSAQAATIQEIQERINALHSEEPNAALDGGGEE